MRPRLFDNLVSVTMPTEARRTGNFSVSQIPAGKHEHDSLSVTGGRFKLLAASGDTNVFCGHANNSILIGVK